MNGSRTSEQQLKTCPFCGKLPALTQASNMSAWWVVTCYYHDCPVMPEAQKQGRAEVIEAWNTRVEPVEPQLPPHDYTHPDWLGNGVTKFWTEASLRAYAGVPARSKESSETTDPTSSA
jgi:Restriction alleviation protein Lar